MGGGVALVARELEMGGVSIRGIFEVLLHSFNSRALRFIWIIESSSKRSEYIVLLDYLGDPDKINILLQKR